MILSPLSESTLFALCFGTLIALAFLNRRRFLFGVGFMLPMMVPRLTLAVGVDWYKVLGPMAIGLAILARPNGVGIQRSGAKLFWWFIGYTSLLTLVWIWAEYGWLQRYRFAFAMGLSGAQAEYKMPVQLGSFLGQILILFAVPLWAKTLEDAWGAVWGFLSGTLFSSLAGFVSMLVLGAGTLNVDPVRGTFEVDGNTIRRLGGLSGEPKFLAASIVSVVLFGVTQWAFGDARLRPKMRVIAFFGLIALFLTYSASAFGGMALGLLVFAAFLIRYLRGTQIASAIVVGGALTLAVSSTALLSGAVQEAIYDKIFSDQTDLGELKDAYVFYAYEDNPEYIPVGFGVGGGDLAVMPYVDYVHLKYERTPTPSFTGTRLLGDLGLAGISILWANVIAWALALRRSGRLGLSVFTVSAASAIMLTSMVGLSGFLFLVGAALCIRQLSSSTTQEGNAQA